MTTNRGAGQRYEVWLGEPGNNPQWRKHVVFRELDRAISFLGYFDPEGTVPMKIYDLWEQRDIDLAEHMPDRPMPEEEKGSWQEEGF